MLSVLILLGACSDIPDACEDEQGGGIACELLRDMPQDMLQDFSTELDAPKDLAGLDSGEEEVETPDMTPTDMCTPRLAMQVCNGICGMQPDGCGGMVECGEPLTAQAACADACGEQSDGCGGSVMCEPCACVNGSPAQPTCGACNLGVSSCDGDTFSCETYDIPGLNAQTDCNAALLYVNGTFDGAMSDGSRAMPFKTIADANAVAKDRGAIAILVGGNENVIYDEMLEVQDGVSVLGGWSSMWTIDTMRVPVIFSTQSEAGDLYGVRVMNVADTVTVLAGFTVKTDDIRIVVEGASYNNYGIHMDNAASMRLTRLVFEVGGGADGLNGNTGSVGLNGVIGEKGAGGYYNVDAQYYGKLSDFDPLKYRCLNCGWGPLLEPSDVFARGGDQNCFDSSEKDRGGGGVNPRVNRQRLKGRAF